MRIEGINKNRHGGTLIIEVKHRLLYTVIIEIQADKLMAQMHILNDDDDEY